MSDQPSSGVPLPRQILVRGVNWLGDAVMTTPALQRLREALPGSHITLLTHQKLADLWQRHPSIDSVATFAPGENAWSVARRLREHHFETALILPNSPRSALEMWLAGIPQRIGYGAPWRNWLLTQTVPSRPGRARMHKRSAREVRRLVSSAAKQRSLGIGGNHQIYDYLHLVTAMGASPEPLPPLLAVKPDEIQSVVSRFALAGTASSNPPLFALNPGAEYGPAKRWPLESFVSAARQVQQRTNCTWLLVGGQSDLPAADTIYSALHTLNSPLKNLAGRTTVRELMAILKLCRLLLANDSGPMHVAAGLGTPVVVPFGSTSPELTGPGLPGDTRHRLLKSDAPCSPCFRRTCPIDFRCMTGLSVGSVVEAVLQAASIQ
jgi:heptosyltransferase II